MIIRIGISSSFRRHGADARAIGAPVLVSANAFWNGQRFQRIDRVAFADLDVALDSAGFVAMFRYWGYRWSLDQYVALVRQLKPAWWAAPDYCCEPEIAGDRAEIIERIKRTAFKLDWARQVAANQDVPPPLPVLQGWQGGDYLRCADMIGELPSLVGLGSVCRRNLGGEHGLLAVLGALDRELPPHVRLHLFGVKGTAVRALTGHPRVFSIDSAAWEFGARMRGRDRSRAERSRFLRQWYATQRDSLGLFGWAPSQ